MNISQQLTRDDYTAGAHAAGHLVAESMVLTFTGDAALQRQVTVSRSPLIEAFADITVLLYDVGHHIGAEVPSDLHLDALVTGELATNCPVDPCRQLRHALLAHEPTREALATVAAQHWDVLLPVISTKGWMAAQTRCPLRSDEGAVRNKDGRERRSEAVVISVATHVLSRNKDWRYAQSGASFTFAQWGRARSR